MPARMGLLHIGWLALSALSSAAVYAAGDKETGKEKALACQICHGKGGRSTNPLYPVLAGQHHQYIVKQLKAFKDGTRKDPIMSDMAASLTDQDMDDLGAFFQSNRNP